MRYFFTFCFVILSGFFSSKAQMLFNMDLENWTQIKEQGTGNVLYEEPGDMNIWTTLNKLRLLSPAAPVTVTKITGDVHSGNYAAKLTTSMMSTMVVPGLIETGFFDPIKPPNLFQGKPFTDRPTKLRCWFKYLPVGGDSSLIAILLYKYNPATDSQDTIGYAQYISQETVSTYTEKVLTLDYYKPGVSPDSIIIVFASSAGAEENFGNIGSTMFVDDVTLEYTGGIEMPLMPAVTVKTNLSADGNVLSVSTTDYTEKGSFIVYSLDGTEIINNNITGTDFNVGVQNLPVGNYFYTLKNLGKSLFTGKFILTR